MKPVMILMLLATLCCSLTTQAEPRESVTYQIQNGQLKVTPARCAKSECLPGMYELHGSFTALISGDGEHLYFPSANVISDAEPDFQLPEDPAFDSGGTTRNITFKAGSGQLTVKGSVDSRAFDGPLIEYKFSARSDDNTLNTANFFSARPDFRECITPLCGGFFVKRVNHRFTRCADGAMRQECYVANIEGVQLTLDNGAATPSTTPFLLQGSIEDFWQKPYGNLGVFKARTGYKSATHLSATTKFFGVENSGIVCITSPCPVLNGYVLNQPHKIALTDLDLQSSGASGEQVQRARDLIAQGSLLPVAGNIERYDGRSGTGIRLVAQQFFLPLATTTAACPEGYQLSNGTCQTASGCQAPRLELTATAGAAVTDPVTGETTADISHQCVDNCNSPAVQTAPGHCELYLP